MSSLVFSQEPMIGEIKMFAGNFAPRGWALCDGQLLPINSNQALFSILGTTYGGDGRTTFALPDLRSRVAIHEGQGPGLSNYRLGQRGGTEDNLININNLPNHNHSVAMSAVLENANTNSPAGAVLAGTGAFDNEYSQSAPNTSLRPENTSSVGSNQPINNVQPYTVVNYIIALQGIFPSRN
jgi:microcystin-dependent protein